MGVGRASNHAEFFPLPLAPSCLGEGGNKKTYPRKPLRRGRVGVGVKHWAGSVHSFFPPIPAFPRTGGKG